MSAVVEAAKFNNRTEAELARLYLSSEGIESVLFDAEVAGFYGGLLMPVRLMVLDEDAGLARELLADRD